jgi:ornithine cyclodeaminase
MKVLTVHDIKQLITKVGIKSFCEQLITYLEQDFAKWESFSKMPRPATHYKEGVIELMPTSDGVLYGFKYVNGHPSNTAKGKLTVMATGQLSLGETGEPLLFSEMNLLTAFRTACASAMAGKYLARKNSTKMAIIGTGAQSEFQSIAMAVVFNITDIYYYDIDSKAMDKFKNNLQGFGFKLHPCSSVAQAVENVDIISTMTAHKLRDKILTKDMIKQGVFINAIGGDCPGKTELDEELVSSSKVFVEYTPQTLIEGEVQSLGEKAIFAELWQVIAAKKPGRENENEVTIFDSVGFAIEDFSTLRLVYDLCKKYNLGQDMEFVPELKDPKDLFSCLK